MAETKTRPTEASIEDYLEARASELQRADCKVLMALLRKVTNQTPKMWGPSIVGYGSYQYTYESGHTGVSCLAGFAIRGRAIVIYLAPSWEGAAGLLAKLGKHKLGKGCLYFKQISDLDLAILEQLLSGSVAELQRRHGASTRS